MNEEEKKAINSLKSFAYTIHRTISVGEAKTVLNLLATQSKQIDLMAKEIHISNIFDCDFKHFKDNKCRLKYPDVPNEYKCKDCIKEYFKKKASEEV